MARVTVVNNTQRRVYVPVPIGLSLGPRREVTMSRISDDELARSASISALIQSNTISVTIADQDPEIVDNIERRFVGGATSVPASEKGAANGIATLDGSGLIPTAQIPPRAIPDVHVVADAAARLALTVQEGDEAIQLDDGSHWIYDGSAWQLRPGTTHAATHSDGGGDEITVENLATAGAAGTFVASDGAGGLTMENPDMLAQQAYYVGKHGNDANGGRSPEDAFLTVGAAVTAASGQTPSTTNRFNIIVMDSGVYAEDITMVAWVNLLAPEARVEGTVELADDSNVKLSEISVSGAVNGVIKPTGQTGTSWIAVDRLLAAGAANGVVNFALAGGGVLIYEGQTVTVENGFAFGDASANLGHIHVDVEDIYITGTGSGIVRFIAGDTTIGRVGHILDVGAGSGTAINANTGEIDLVVGRIDCNTAYNVGAAGILNMVVNVLSGAETVAGTANVLKSEHVNDSTNPHGTTLQGAYDASTSPEITVDATRGGLTLRDNATPIGAPLFEIEDNGAVPAFRVNSTSNYVELLPTTRTYTAFPAGLITVPAVTHTHNYVNPRMIGMQLLHTFEHAQTGFALNHFTMFSNAVRFKNQNGSAVNFGPGQTFLAQPKIEADGASVSMGIDRDFVSQTVFQTINAGTLNVTSWDQFQAAGSITTGATVATRRGFAFQNLTTATGTLTNNIGVDIENLTSGTNRIGIRSAMAVGTFIDHTGTAQSNLTGTLNMLGSADITLTAGATVDGRDVSADGAKLDGLPTGIEQQHKQSVRVATIAAGTFATDFENGDTVDGIVLATGDRILIKDQGTVDAGIFIVQATGAPVRAADLPVAVSAAATIVAVQEGTVNGDTLWICVNNVGLDVVGTDAIAFLQINVRGPTLSTDEAIARFNGTNGKVLQNSLVTINDTGALQVRNIIPQADNTYNIGTSTSRPANIRTNFFSAYNTAGATVTVTRPGNFASCYFAGTNAAGGSVVSTGYGSFALGNCGTVDGGSTTRLEATSFGSFAGGSCYAYSGNSSRIFSSNFGSFAWGQTNSVTGVANMDSTGQGSCTIGYSQCNGHASLLAATNNGAFAQGIASSTGGSGGGTGSQIRATGLGSFAQGRTTNTSTGTADILASGNGSFAQGFTSAAVAQTGMIQATQPGAFAHGNAASGTIEATGNGAFAVGNINTGGIIQASGNGSFALGDGTSGTVQATQSGAFAVGNAGAGTISAGASNAAQFGIGTNTLADSLQVGAAGLRFKGTAGAPGTPQNGDVWVAANVVTVQSNGTAVGVGQLPSLSRHANYISTSSAVGLNSVTWTNIAGTWTQISTADFTLNTSTGVVTYTGTPTKIFQGIFTVSASVDAGTIEVFFRVELNGTDQASTEQQRTISGTGAGEVGNASVPFELSLATNDTINLAALVNAGTPNLTAEFCHLHLVEVG